MAKTSISNSLFRLTTDQDDFHTVAKHEKTPFNLQSDASSDIDFRGMVAPEDLLPFQGRQEMLFPSWLRGFRQDTVNTAHCEDEAFDSWQFNGEADDEVVARENAKFRITIALNNIPVGHKHDARGGRLGTTRGHR